MGAGGGYVRVAAVFWMERSDSRVYIRDGVVHRRRTGMPMFSRQSQLRSGQIHNLSEDLLVAIVTFGVTKRGTPD